VTCRSGGRPHRSLRSLGPSGLAADLLTAPPPRKTNPKTRTTGEYKKATRKKVTKGSEAKDRSFAPPGSAQSKLGEGMHSAALRAKGPASDSFRPSFRHRQGPQAGEWRGAPQRRNGRPSASRAMGSLVVPA
jgi:hypothetical protein